MKSVRDVIPGWEKKTVVVLETLIVASGIYQTFFGETVIGVITLICAVVIVAPGLFTRNFIEKFPIEIEIILFIMVLFQFVLGEARDFYNNIPYYDKLVHFMMPMFLGILGFLVFYTLYITGKMKTSIFAMMFIIILITLGIGAAWEIVEYLSDVFLLPTIPGWHQFQGNPQQDALNDTMTDLIVDTLGGVFGALLALWLLGKQFSQTTRRDALLSEINAVFYRNPKLKKTKSRTK